MYDYLIIGAGLFGATFAWHATQAGKQVLVIDKRTHIGGNCYTYDEGGIQVHQYGPHIFHTSNKQVWDFINRFARFNSYVHRVKTINEQHVYSMPINMMTLHQVFGSRTPFEADIALQRARIPCQSPRNLEEWITSQVGRELYEAVIKGYTIKQWGRDPRDLPTSIIRRLPIRMTWDDNYYNDTYQGIPIGGYTQIFASMLEKCDIQLGVDFFAERSHLESISKKTIFSGMIDEFYEHSLGKLEYRTLDFETEIIQKPDYQGTAQMNYASLNVPWTRIVEHKHFDPVTTNHTIITREIPREWKLGDTPYYPINDNKNNASYEGYHRLAEREPRTLFGGRLASYKYRDMHQVIAEAMTLAKKEGLVQ